MDHSTRMLSVLFVDAKLDCFVVQNVCPHYGMQKSQSSGKVWSRSCKVERNLYGASFWKFTQSVGCRVPHGWRHTNFS